MSTLTIKKQAKKRNTKRREVELYAGDAYSLAKRTAAGLNYIRKLINIETKFFDTISTAAPNNTTGTIINVSGVAQGLDISDRVGDSIKLQRFSLMTAVNVNIAAVDSLLRILVVRDHENLGTAPAIADVFTGAAVAQSPILPYNYINFRSRFTPIYDVTVPVSYAGDGVVVNNFTTEHSGHIKYRGTTGANANMAEGVLYVIYLSSETTNVPTIRYAARIEFTDD